MAQYNWIPSSQNSANCGCVPLNYMDCNWPNIGATGATGPANGPVGATGASGSNGSEGSTGATGVAGTDGATGATGPSSPAGGDRWSYTSDGITFVYNISGAISTMSTAFFVAFDGIFQDPNDYTITSGTPHTITFSTAPASGVVIVIVSLNGIQGATGANGSAVGATGATGQAGATGIGSQGATGASGSAGGATGAGTDAIFFLNGQTVNTSYTIPTLQNAGTFGPVTIDVGVAVTIPSGSVWTIV